MVNYGWHHIILQLKYKTCAEKYAVLSYFYGAEPHVPSQVSRVGLLFIIQMIFYSMYMSYMNTLILIIYIIFISVMYVNIICIIGYPV